MAEVKIGNEQRNIMLMGWIAGRIYRGLQVEKSISFKVTETDFHYPFTFFGRAMNAWYRNHMEEVCEWRDKELTEACAHIDSDCDAVLNPWKPIPLEMSGQVAFGFEKAKYGDHPLPEMYKLNRIKKTQA